MLILAHRGIWKDEREKNTLPALKRALSEGFGIETDFRDYHEELVISHNVASSKSPLANELFSFYHSLDIKPVLALNVKADGIQDAMKSLLQKYCVENYFFFDMSIPEMVVYKKMDLKFFTRHSDIENECVLYPHARGVWLDSFYEEDWLSKEIIDEHIKNKKDISIISPEIHGIDNQNMWGLLKESGYHLRDDIMLCTDVPVKAKEYFEV